MKTIWFCTNAKNEDIVISIAEVIGEELIRRDQYVELVVQSEVNEILGRGLKDTPEDKATFIDRLGFLGNLLHRNEIFALVVTKDSNLNDRKLVKETYSNYIQVNMGEKDLLTDILLDKMDDPKFNAKKIIEYLIGQKIIPEKGQEVYSKEAEEEIRRRLEELGYV